MDTFQFRIIDLPPSLYTPGTSFARAWSISPNGRYIVGNAGPKPVDPNEPLLTDFRGYKAFQDLSVSFDFLFDAPPFEAFGTPKSAFSCIGVNDGGDVVGLYRDELHGQEIRGYRWFFGQQLQDFNVTKDFGDFPSAIASGRIEHNTITGINNRRVIVGAVLRKSDSRDIGFVWSDAGPQFFGLPHGPLLVDIGDSCAVRAINSVNHFVGNFSRQGVTHGFKWRVNSDDPFFDDFEGQPVFIDVASQGATAFPPTNTRIKAINDSGWIVGSYETVENGVTIPHGFLWKPDAKNQDKYVPGNHVTLDIAGATGTWVEGISNAGVFVGYFRIPGPMTYAFIGYPLPVP